MRLKWLDGKAVLLRERNFRRFYVGYVTSLLGSAMSPIAIAWAVLQSGGSASDLGLVLTANVVPQVAFMTFAGAIADRIGRPQVMLTADVTRCAGRAALAVALIVGHPSIPLFIALAFVAGTGDAFFSPAFGALTVQIAPRDQLGNANALYGIASSATRIAGPALSGALVALAGPALVVAMDSASFGISVLALASLRLPAWRSADGERRSLVRDMAQGWGDFRRRTWLWTTTVQFAFFNLITWAPWMLLGPVAGRTYLGGAGVWGAIMVLQGAGALVGGALSLGRRPRRPMVVATIGTFCYALPDIPMALHAGALWVAPAAFGCGVGSVVFGTFYDTTTQQQIPPELLARLNALTLVPAYAIGAIGYAVDGPLAAAIGARLVFGIGAIYGLASSALVLTIPAIRATRWTDEEPVPAVDDSSTAVEGGR